MNNGNNGGAPFLKSVTFRRQPKEKKKGYKRVEFLYATCTCCGKTREGVRIGGIIYHRKQLDHKAMML